MSDDDEAPPTCCDGCPRLDTLARCVDCGGWFCPDCSTGGVAAHTCKQKRIQDHFIDPHSLIEDTHCCGVLIGSEDAPECNECGKVFDGDLVKQKRAEWNARPEK